MTAKRVALVPSEPLRERMAGIGIRYLELARRLPERGLEVVLVTAGDIAEVPDTGLPADRIRRFERGRLAELLADCQVVVSQGQLANDVVLELADTPCVIDLYDPFLIENMHYVDSLGLDPYRNDHATFRLQLARGDFFLCSCLEQRLFYLGFLAALGRVNPHRLAIDPDLDGLIGIVPFGISDDLPAPRPLLAARREGDRRLLFGGLYDWYDPWPLLRLLERRRQQTWSLLVIRNPNTGTPQKLFGDVERWCRQRQLWHEPAADVQVETGARVEVLDWLPSDRRFDLLREVDALTVTHRLDLETRLSLRTRFLDALAVGCPVISTEGGAMSRMLSDHDAGWVVPVADDEALERAVDAALSDSESSQAKRAGSRRLLESFTWQRSLEPLVEFCRQPEIDRTKRDFTQPLSTHAPADGFGFRLRRFLRRRLQRLRQGDPSS